MIYSIRNFTYFRLERYLRPKIPIHYWSQNVPQIKNFLKFDIYAQLAWRGDKSFTL